MSKKIVCGSLFIMSLFGCAQMDSSSGLAGSQGRTETEVSIKQDKLSAVFSTEDSARLFEGLALTPKHVRVYDAPSRDEKTFETGDSRFQIFCSKALMEKPHYFCFTTLSLKERGDQDVVYNREENGKLIARVAGFNTDEDKLYAALAGFPVQGNDDHVFKTTDGKVEFKCWLKPSFHGAVTLCDLSFPGAK